MCELYEIINFKEVIEYINSKYQNLKINKGTILKLHEILMKALIDGNGYYRTRNIYVSGSKYIPHYYRNINIKKC